MRALKNLGFLFTLMAVFAMVSCEDDGTGGGGGTGGNDGFPVVKVEGPGTDITADIGDTLTFTIEATAGDSDLAGITVQEEGVAIPASSMRVLSDGVPVLNNPFSLAGDETMAFTKDISIVVKDAVATLNYKIIVTASGGKNVETAFSVTTVGLPPSLAFTSSMNGDVTIDVNSLQGYPLTGFVGTGQLDSIRITENGVLLDPSRIDWDGSAASSNPFTVGTDNVDGFEGTNLIIRSNTEVGVYDYVAVLIDQFGLESPALTFTITTQPAGTPVSVDMGVLFNSAGPVGTGGLDLDDAVGTGSMSALAEIRDLGLDAADNWRREIGSVNGSTIKYIIPGQNGVDGNWSFDNVMFQEELVDLDANGVDYNSETVEAGDVFSVTRDGNNYLIRIAQINEVLADNSDNYVVDIIK